MFRNSSEIPTNNDKQSSSIISKVRKISDLGHYPNNNDHISNMKNKETNVKKEKNGSKPKSKFRINFKKKKMKQMSIAVEPSYTITGEGHLSFNVIEDNME